MDEPLPELQQGRLDLATLWALVEEIETLGRVLEVSVKGAPAARARSELGLRAGVEALVAGGVRGVQVRYAYDGREWVDTLLRDGQGVRVVRMG
jgi:hypothetical protein